MRSLLLLILLLLGTALRAQSYRISGYIRDSATGETLIGAVIYPKSDPQKGVGSNAYGFYSLQLPAGEYLLVVRYLGYREKEIPVNLKSDLRLNIRLESEAARLQEVVVRARRANENVSTTRMSTTRLDMEQVEQIPALMGEIDIMKTIQLLPGVMSAGEGNTGLYVRGGGPDQNLILLDEAPVYNPGHLFGFFSVFNGDAIKNTTLIKGGIPARYGGRLSSVVDIAMKDGNNRHFSAEGGIGLISSRLTLEGPIVKDRSSFMVSGRRTYADMLLKPFLKGSRMEGNAYYFYDLNAKANYRFSDKDRLYASAYFGRDVFSFTGSSGNFNIQIPWGNSTGTLRWNHLFSDKLFMNASLIYNDYNFSMRAEQLGFRFKFFSRIEDWSGKVDFDWFLGNKSKASFGAGYTFHTMTPITASVDASQDSVLLETDRVSPKYARDLWSYFSLERDLSSRLRLTAGLRGIVFQQQGPYRYLIYDEQGRLQDSVLYGKGETIKSYYGLEPRLNLRFMINEASSLKAGYMRTQQNLHLVSNSNATLPTDIWVPSSILVAPELADQLSIGYFRNFNDNRYETSLELYYKKLQNQLEFEDGYIPGLNEEVERSFVSGTGRSYGIELYIKKQRGKLNGWIGYTLSRTERIFPDINNGKPFPARYDRRHDLSLVAIYKVSARWVLSGTFVYGSGSTLTMPESWYFIDGNITAEYGSRNSYRMAPYHRLDLSAMRKGKEHKNFSSEWVFSVYNVYSRLNPYFIYFDTEGDVQSGNVNLRARQVSIFPVIPSVTWNFKLK